MTEPKKQQHLEDISKLALSARTAYDLRMIRSYATQYHLTDILEQVDVIWAAYQQISDLSRAALERSGDS